MPAVSLLVATQLTAIATAVLAAGAIISAIFAFLAFQKQATEVNLLLAQNKREVEFRRREQAVRVLIWSDSQDNLTNIHVRNSSDQPIYRTMTIRVSDQKLVGWQNIGPLMPGEDRTFSREADDIITEPDKLVFTDINGIRWSTSEDGQPVEWVRLPSRKS